MWFSHSLKFRICTFDTLFRNLTFQYAEPINTSLESCLLWRSTEMLCNWYRFKWKYRRCQHDVPKRTMYKFMRSAGYCVYENRLCVTIQMVKLKKDCLRLCSDSFEIHSAENRWILFGYLDTSYLNLKWGLFNSFTPFCRCKSFDIIFKKNIYLFCH